FHDLSAARLLHRYNLALAQGILLKAVRLTIDVRREQPARLRALIRRIKFHRLICKATATEGSCHLELDGPLSLFGATQKYGVQLASFLPALVPCRDFELTAEVLWGRERRPKTLTITHEDGLVADAADPGGSVPSELAR